MHTCKQNSWYPSIARQRRCLIIVAIIIIERDNIGTISSNIKKSCIKFILIASYRAVLTETARVEDIVHHLAGTGAAVTVPSSRTHFGTTCNEWQEKVA